jgi:membrane protease YdiL (CAAX protease family)
MLEHQDRKELMQSMMTAHQLRVVRTRLIAPVWHTAFMVLLFLVPFTNWLPLKSWFGVVQRSDVPFIYIMELQLQWIFFVLMWLGLLMRDSKFTELIGKLWKTMADGRRDCGLAVVLLLVDVALALLLSYVFGEFYRTPRHTMPRNLLDLAAILPVMISAGICEEITFRGYLQTQFHRMTGSIWVAIFLQAVIFSLAHGYDQTAAGMFSKFSYGIMTGLLAKWRGSLLPGIVSHSLMDALVALTVVLL